MGDAAAAMRTSSKRREDVERERGWWRTTEETDPITLSPFVREPFRLGAHWFDADVLASFLVSTAHFQHPLTREEISREDCRRLDEHLAMIGAERVDVTGAFDLMRSARVAPGMSEERRRRATVMFRNLFMSAGGVQARGSRGGEARARGSSFRGGRGGGRGSHSHSRGGGAQGGGRGGGARGGGGGGAGGLRIVDDDEDGFDEYHANSTFDFDLEFPELFPASHDAADVVAEFPGSGHHHQRPGVARLALPTARAASLSVVPPALARSPAAEPEPEEPEPDHEPEREPEPEPPQELITEPKVGAAEKVEEEEPAPEVIVVDASRLPGKPSRRKAKTAPSSRASALPGSGAAGVEATPFTASPPPRRTLLRYLLPALLLLVVVALGFITLRPMLNTHKQ